ncbi:DNA alkylation repair protein [Cohnella sp. REN36]|uniref:DNA alkylation repair protein n=1 Tax=Cohnella sp. REN36 TaxID=2887347 RepID=UPI001D14BB72|nr:DNA alkylation repair protein [Cohnella sp. REN36]MCC3377469.1 DNA alkylation repair protein [Cohnella sp. REN36]
MNKSIDPEAYVADLASLLRAHANPAEAVRMAAYMKNRYPFFGIKSPAREALTRQFAAERGIPEGEALERVVLALWAQPERELQNVAMSLLERRIKRADRGLADLLERLIADKSWWDTVDMLAGKLAGTLFAKYPDLIPAYPDRWILSDNLWLRRSALLFQLAYRERTDTDRLFRYIRLCAGETDFFIRKAIGWALRQYARTDADAVRAFVRETSLSPLSAKEALKHIGAE